jgi:hypothetical protein
VDKHLIRIEINNLLDAHCHGCKLIAGHKGYSAGHNEAFKICQSCPYYKQIRQLGDQLLIRSEPKMKMTVEEYKAFKLKKLSIKEIAKAKNVSPASVYSWKIAHKDEIKNAGIEPKTAKNEPKTNENTKKVNDSANQLVAGKLSAKVKEQESVIAKLRVSLAERDRQVDALVEDKRKWLEEQDKLKSDIEPPQINSLKEQLDTEKKLNESVHHNLSVAQKTIVQLKNEKADLLKSTQKQADTINALQKNLDSANKLYQEKCKQIDDLNADADDLEIEASKQKEASERYQKLYGKEISEHTTHCQQLRAAMNFIHTLTAK